MYCTLQSPFLHCVTFCLSPSTFTISANHSTHLLLSLLPLICQPKGRNCSCFAKLSPLPKYRQLRVVVTSVQSIDEDNDDDHSTSSSSSSSSSHRHNHNVTEHGHSTLFVLTDVATVSMLTDLYKVSKP